MIGAVLGWIKDFFSQAFAVILSFFSNFFGWLIDGLITLLKALFYPVLVVISLIFYFVYKLGELVVTLFSVLLSMGKLLYAFVQGIIATFAGFVWTPTTPDHGSWSHAFGQAFAALEQDYQLDTIAYILMFCIWIITAFAAIRLISGSRGGGE